MFHSVFSPSSLTLDVLSKTLVQRQALSDRLINIFENTPASKSTHNVLLIGPRGIGKTHLVSLVYKRLKATDAFNKNQRIAYLREDEWGITSYVDLLLRLAESLFADAAETDFKTILNKRIGHGTALSEQDAEELFLEALGERRGLLIIENLGRVFDAIQEDGQLKFRSILQNSGSVSILGTTPALFSAVSRQTSPFYGFFQLTYLKPLSVDDAVLMIQKLSATAGEDRTAAFVATPIGRARIRAVQHLAGGNHRIFVLFYDFLRQTKSESVLEPLLKTIDSLTPYYQEQMTRLSPQQQKIVGFLCRQRVPLTVKAIAAGCLVTQQTAASQLKQLKDFKYVRVSRTGRESYYELAEPLLRICIEAKTYREGPLKVLVEFLRFWFSPEELQEHLSSSADSDKQYFSAALREYELTDGHDHLDPDIAALCASLDDPHLSLDEMRSNALELAELAKRAGDWSHYCRGMVKQEKVKEALRYLEQKVDPKIPNPSLFYALGRGFFQDRQFAKAVDVLWKAITLSPQSHYMRLELVRALTELDRLDEAEEQLNLLKKDKRMKSEATVLWARVQTARGNSKRAIDILTQLRQKEGADDHVLSSLAVALQKDGQLTKAIEILQEAEKLAPNALYIKYNLVNAQYRNKDYEGAIRTANQLIRDAPGVGNAIHHGRCLSLLAMNEFKTAEESTPSGMLSHALFHQLLDAYNARLGANELIERIRKLAEVRDTDRWRKAMIGAMIEFLRTSKGWDYKDLESELRKWLLACQTVFGHQDDWLLVLKVFEALLSVKFRKNYKSLFALTLEERRLLLSEDEELALLGSKDAAFA